MNVAWWLLIVVASFAAGALLGVRDGASRTDQRWTAATEKKRAEDIAAARVVEAARFRNMEVAYRANQMEHQKLRAAALAADRAARGLRDDLAAVRRAMPADSGTACRAALDACHAVLGDCSERYRDVAQAADDHAADARLCLEGWPQ